MDVIDILMAKMLSGGSGEATPEQIAAAVTGWLEDNVNPVGSAVVVDSSLSIEGAAADAQVTGTRLAEKISMPSGGQAGQALISDGEGGAEWDNVSVEVDATLTEAGKAADAKAVGDALVSGDFRLPLREVSVPLIDYGYGNDNWEMGGGTNQGVAPALTPYAIRVNNTSTQNISLTVRWLDGDDPETATIVYDVNSSGEGVRGKIDWSCPAGQETEFVLEEYGRTPTKYIQFKWINYPKPNPSITFIYDDNPLPEPKLDDSDDAYALDFPMRWVIRGLYSGYNYKYLLCVVPFYPDTWYYVRNGFGLSAYNTNPDIRVSGVTDDKIFDVETYEDPLQALYYGGSVSSSYPAKFTIYKSLIAERELVGSDRSWMRVKTKSWAETKGCKFLVFNMNITTSALGGGSDAMTQEAMEAELEAQKAVVNNTYVSRFNKYLARSMDSRLVVQNDAFFDNIPTYQNNPLWGANWVLFGDSLTDAYGGHDLASTYFAARIAKEYNMSIDNRAKSGSNINTGANSGMSGVSYQSVNGCAMLDEFIAAVGAGTAEAPDYITIAFGSNGYADQVGSPSDTSANKVNTCGAVKYFIETIRAEFPNAVFGFVLPPLADWSGTDTRKDVDATRAAMKSVLELDGYRVPFIDMSTQSGITAAMLPDGIHISSDQAQNLYYHAIRRFVMGL